MPPVRNRDVQCTQRSAASVAGISLSVLDGSSIVQAECRLHRHDLRGELVRRVEGTSAGPVNMPLAPGTILGPYSVTAKIGAGRTSGRSAPGPVSRGSHGDLPTRRLVRGRSDLGFLGCFLFAASSPPADETPRPARLRTVWSCLDVDTAGAAVPANLIHRLPNFSYPGTAAARTPRHQSRAAPMGKAWPPLAVEGSTYSYRKSRSVSTSAVPWVRRLS